MSSTPLGTRSLKVLIDGVERYADVTNCSIEAAAADADVTTFFDAAQGGKREYTLKGTALQDPADATSLWNLMWLHLGEEIPIVLNPYGGGTLSATNPGFAGTVVVSEPDGTFVGGEADESTTARFTNEFEWKFTEKPTLVTTGDYGEPEE
jgi:hypothetical protein